MSFSSMIERVGWCWIWYWLISKKAPSSSSSHWRHKQILAKHFKRTGRRTITLRIAGFLLAYPLCWGISCMQIAVCADLISSDDTQAKLFRLTHQIRATLSPSQGNHTCQHWALKLKTKKGNTGVLLGELWNSDKAREGKRQEKPRVDRSESTDRHDQWLYLLDVSRFLISWSFLTFKPTSKGFKLFQEGREYGILSSCELI